MHRSSKILYFLKKKRLSLNWFNLYFYRLRIRFSHFLLITLYQQIFYHSIERRKAFQFRHTMFLECGTNLMIEVWHHIDDSIYSLITVNPSCIEIEYICKIAVTVSSAHRLTHCNIEYFGNVITSQGINFREIFFTNHIIERMCTTALWTLCRQTVIRNENSIIDIIYDIFSTLLYSSVIYRKS